MELLSGLIRQYAWGSHEAIARLQGRPAPTAEPEAELWLGAHPDSPSTLERDGRPVSLVDVVARAPERVLGARAVAEFGPRLPFLLKVLAAEQPLSMQAHPDAARAREAYHAERAAGDGPYSYTDPYHKPEMLVACTEFDALCGFRDPAVSAEALARLKVPALEPVVAALADEDRGRALRTAVETLLRWPERERAELIAAAVAGAGNDPELDLVALTARRFPTDPAVLVAMLLNRVVLRPGQAIWMPAGNLHAYLSGVGIEAMASSDNVLRGGFTPKPVNVTELLRALRFEVLDDPLLPAAMLAPGLVTWPVPVSDFTLFRAAVAGPGGAPGTGEVPGTDAVADGVEVPVAGPAVALCVAGSVVVDDGAGEIALGQGRAAFAQAGGEPVRITGEGTVFVLSTGL
jgi:mannose-6-phosphate isomerase